MKSGRMLNTWIIATMIQKISRSFGPSSNAALCEIPRASGKSDGFAEPLLEPNGAGPRLSPATARTGDSTRLSPEELSGDCAEDTCNKTSYNGTYSTDRSRLGPL